MPGVADHTKKVRHTHRLHHSLVKTLFINVPPRFLQLIRGRLELLVSLLQLHCHCFQLSILGANGFFEPLLSVVQLNAQSELLILHFLQLCFDQLQLLIVFTRLYLQTTAVLSSYMSAGGCIH